MRELWDVQLKEAMKEIVILYNCVHVALRNCCLRGKFSVRYNKARIFQGFKGRGFVVEIGHKDIGFPIETFRQSHDMCTFSYVFKGVKQ